MSSRVEQCVVCVVREVADDARAIEPFKSAPRDHRNNKENRTRRHLSGSMPILHKNTHTIEHDADDGAQTVRHEHMRA